VFKVQGSIVEPGDSHSSPEEDKTGVEALMDTPSSVESPASEQAQSPVPGGQAESPASEQALVVVPSVDSEDQSPPTVDVWLDVALLRYLETDAHVSGISQRERDRIWHRARTYRLKDGVLHRVEAEEAPGWCPNPSNVLI
jgi:hypothetical protein